jgi:uncharacterized protein (TIGR03000 family)
VDPSGRDIVVLFGADIGAGGIKVGHPAILVGNETTGWDYLSFHAGGKKTTTDNVVKMHFDTVADAKANKETKEYGEYLYIPTTADQDAAVLAQAQKWVKDGPQNMLGKLLENVIPDFRPYFGDTKRYKLTNQNCSTFATDLIVSALGKDAGFPQYVGLKLLRPLRTYEEWYPRKWWPNQVVPWANAQGYGPFPWHLTDGQNVGARLIVNVPNANASVFLDNAPTTSTGTRRVYDVPPLAPGNYQYEVRAVFESGGIRVEKTVTVQIHPGEAKSVTFGGR